MKGRRLDDLGLGDDPIPPRTLVPSREEEQARAEHWLEQLREMLDDDKHHFAWGLLTDMRLTIEQTGRVSDNQIRAISNIAEGAIRGQEKREWSKHAQRHHRRYEGWVGGD